MSRCPLWSFLVRNTDIVWGRVGHDRTSASVVETEYIVDISPNSGAASLFELYIADCNIARDVAAANARSAAFTLYCINSVINSASTLAICTAPSIGVAPSQNTGSARASDITVIPLSVINGISILFSYSLGANPSSINTHTVFCGVWPARAAPRSSATGRAPPVIPSVRARYVFALLKSPMFRKYIPDRYISAGFIISRNAAHWEFSVFILLANVRLSFADFCVSWTNASYSRDIFCWRAYD